MKSIKASSIMFVLVAAAVCLGITMPLKAQAQDTAPESELVWDVREWTYDTYETKPVFPEVADEELVRKDGHIYKLKSELISEDSRFIYGQMDEEKKAKFHKIRTSILGKFAAMLDRNASLMGVAVVTKNKILGVFKKGQKVEGTFKEIGRISAENMINGLNTKLWREAQKVAEAKEISLVINPSAGAFMGFPNKFHLGGTLGVAMNIGYNVESDVLFVTLNGTIEKLKSGFVVFVNAKLVTGLQFDADPAPGYRLGRDPRKAGFFRRDRSEIFYPLYVPFFESSGEGKYGLGISSAIPIIPGEFFFYKNDMTILRFMKLELPTEGFWRMIYHAFSVMRVPDHVTERFAQRAHIEFKARTCRGLFL